MERDAVRTFGDAPMRTALLLPLLALFASTGCVVVSDDSPPPPPPPPPPANYAPMVDDAQAGCYWDGYDHTDAYFFQAAVWDDDGLGDVTDVWADVYDEGYGGQYVESFELYPTNDPSTWYSDWLAPSTGLDCWYPNYSVDFVVYDAYGATGYTTVWAAAY